MTKRTQQTQRAQSSRETLDRDARPVGNYLVERIDGAVRFWPRERMHPSLLYWLCIALFTFTTAWVARDVWATHLPDQKSTMTESGRLVLARVVVAKTPTLHHYNNPGPYVRPLTNDESDLTVAVSFAIVSVLALSICAYSYVVHSRGQSLANCYPVRRFLEMRTRDDPSGVPKVSAIEADGTSFDRGAFIGRTMEGVGGRFTFVFRSKGGGCEGRYLRPCSSEVLELLDTVLGPTRGHFSGNDFASESTIGALIAVGLVVGACEISLSWDIRDRTYGGFSWPIVLQLALWLGHFMAVELLARRYAKLRRADMMRLVEEGVNPVVNADA